MQQDIDTLIEENLALRCLLGGGCDANDDGLHPTIAERGKDRFCVDCGEMVEAKGRSKPWFDNARLERVKQRIRTASDCA